MVMSEQFNATEDELSELTRSIEKSITSLYDRCFEHNSWIQDISARFRLWLKVSGVLHSGRASLAHRLRLHEIGFLVVRNILGILEANFEVFCHAMGLETSPSHTSHNKSDDQNLPTTDVETDSGTDDDSPVNPASIAVSTRTRIDEDLSRLIEYTNLINEQSRIGRVSKMDSFDPQGFLDDDLETEPKSLTPCFTEYTQLSVQRIIGPKQWKELRRSRPLFANRLIQTIIRRWRHLSYRISRTKDKEESQKTQVRSDIQQPFINKSLPLRQTDQPITAVPKLQAEVQARPATVSEGSTLQPNANLSLVKKSSAPRTATIANNRGLDFPTRPVIRSIEDNRREFHCRYCNQLVQITKVKGEAEAWQQHLLADFKPYICPYEQCDESFAMYGTFREWNEHMEINHEDFVWYCGYCESMSSSREAFSSEEAFRKHIELAHHERIADVLPIPQPTLQRACDLCGKEPDEGTAGNMPAIAIHSRALKCLAQHLTEFALLSIPWHFEISEYRGSDEAQEDSHRDDMSLDSKIDAQGVEQTFIPQPSNEDAEVLKDIKNAFPDEESIFKYAEEWTANVTNSNLSENSSTSEVPKYTGANQDISSGTNTGMHKELTRSDYMIGWFCTLDIEMAAAAALLDEEYPEPSSPAHDTNSYTLGRIGAHNIVVASYVVGQYGMTSTMMRLTHLVESFPSIRYILMVGIGGGVPPNVRLGDVVVGTSEEKSGGVIQYDPGKMIAAPDTLISNIGRVRSLWDPPEALSQWIAGLRVQATITGYRFNEHCQQVFNRYPKMRREFTRPNVDNLYQSSYIHQSGQRNCSACDSSKLIQREAITEPRVHYGIIGSADIVLKDAALRDSLYARDNVICFDMEAADINQDFRGVVIRGICDYCDTHRNKSWQPYAALMAASYAKELLLSLPVESVESMPTYMASSVTEERDPPSKENRSALQRLYPIDPRDDKNRIEESTGGVIKQSCAWILKHEDFLYIQQQRKKAGKLLWINGGPGKGKTMLLCSIIDELELHQNVIYFFCQYEHGTNDTATAVVRGLIYMLYKMRPNIPHLVADKIDATQTEEFTFRDLAPLLERMLQGVDVCVCVDALDECISELDMLLDFILRTSKKHKTRWIVTSRNSLKIRESLMKDLRLLSLEKNHKSVSDAVAKYIDVKVAELSQAKRYNESFAGEVKEYLHVHAEDTFLWVASVYHTLASTAGSWHGRYLLQISHPTLEALYDRWMEEIEDLEDAELLKMILRFTSLTSSPINLNELDAMMNIPDHLRKRAIFLEATVYDCGRFICLWNSSVKFVHVSAREYVKNRLVGDGKKVNELHDEVIRQLPEVSAPDP